MTPNPEPNRQTVEDIANTIFAGLSKWDDHRDFIYNNLVEELIAIEKQGYERGLNEKK